MDTVHINIKPLSTNRLYVYRKGRRHKTKDYSDFERTLCILLPPPRKVDIPSGDLLIHYEFGVSRSFDIDNCVKAFQDVLSSRYQFDDNRIRFFTVLKAIAKRGDEYIKFKILPYCEGSWGELTQ